MLAGFAVYLTLSTFVGVCVCLSVKEATVCGESFV